MSKPESVNAITILRRWCLEMDESELVLAVFKQAIRDVKDYRKLLAKGFFDGIINNKPRIKTRYNRFALKRMVQNGQNAVHFLMQKNPYFDFYCSMIGLNTEAARKIILRELKDG